MCQDQNIGDGEQKGRRLNKWKSNIATVWRPASQFPQQLYVSLAALLLKKHFTEWKALRYSYSLIFSLIQINDMYRWMESEIDKLIQLPVHTVKSYEAIAFFFDMEIIIII